MATATVVTKTSLPKTIAGKSGTVFSKLWKFMKYFFYVSLAIVISIQAGAESIKTKSPFPFLYHTFGRLLSADELIYHDLKLAQEKGITLDTSEGITATIKNILKKGSIWYAVFVNIGTIILVYWLIYRYVWRKAEDSKRIKAHLYTILTLIIMQMLLSGILYTVWAKKDDPRAIIPNEAELSDYQLGIEVGKRFIPFKGTGLLLKSIINKLNDPSFILIKESYADASPT